GTGWHVYMMSPSASTEFTPIVRTQLDISIFPLKQNTLQGIHVPYYYML
ncbi:hypothetical protein SAMN04489725_1101, partial [Alicyclobacillus hesperidum]